MSEIVYTETQKSRAHIPDMGHGRKPADCKFTLFQSRDKVALVRSHLIVGVPKVGHWEQTDKRYYYWRSNYSFGFRRNSAGNIVAYQCQRPWDAKYKDPWRHQQARAPFELLREDGEDGYSDQLAHEFKRAVWSSFDVTTIEDIFPMLPRYGLERYQTIPHNLHGAFRADDWAEFAARAFGKTRVTPRLVAAVKGTDPYFVAYARNFRGLVDTDRLVTFMERNHFDDEMEENFRPHTPDFRKGVLAAPVETRKALIDLQVTLEDMKRIQSVTSIQKNYMERSFQRGFRNNTPTSWKEINAW